MAVVVQPNPITPDERMGLQLGQLEGHPRGRHRHAPHGPVRATGGRRLSAVGLSLIGTGMWAGHVAKAAARTPSVELVNCFSRDAGRREAFAAEAGCEAASSFEAAIDDPTVEAVALVTPNFTHGEQAAACAERGKHVFVEKPIADTLEDGRAIRAACEDAGVALLVGHDLRRLGAARAAKRLDRRGRAGPRRPGRPELLAHWDAQARVVALPPGDVPRRPAPPAWRPPCGHAALLARARPSACRARSRASSPRRRSTMWGSRSSTWSRERGRRSPRATSRPRPTRPGSSERRACSTTGWTPPSGRAPTSSTAPPRSG